MSLQDKISGIEKFLEVYSGSDYAKSNTEFTGPAVPNLSGPITQVGTTATYIGKHIDLSSSATPAEHSPTSLGAQVCASKS